MGELWMASGIPAACDCFDGAAMKSTEEEAEEICYPIEFGSKGDRSSCEKEIAKALRLRDSEIARLKGNQESGPVPLRYLEALLDLEKYARLIPLLECKNSGNMLKPHCAVCGFYEALSALRALGEGGANESV